MHKTVEPPSVCALDAGMTDKEIIEWIKASLQAAGKSQQFLADLLGIDKGQVSKLFGAKLKRGEKLRKITFLEVVKIAETLGVDLPGGGELTKAADVVGGIPVRGRVAEKTWVQILREDLTVAPQHVGAVLHPSYPVKDQSAYQVDQPGLPGEIYKRGDFLITVPFADYRSKPIPDELIVVKRTKGSLVSYGLRRVVQESKRVALKPVLQGWVDDPDAETQLWALVINFQRNLV